MDSIIPSFGVGGIKVNIEELEMDLDGILTKHSSSQHTHTLKLSINAVTNCP